MLGGRDAASIACVVGHSPALTHARMRAIIKAFGVPEEIELGDFRDAPVRSMTERLSVVQGDIVLQRVDVIVNAANSALSGGGGVDGAVHRAAGAGLLAECMSLGRCPTGQSVITGGYDLFASYVVHTVGPVWEGGHKGERDALRSCYQTALQLAANVRARTMAFPAISCGAYKFPAREAARIAVEETLTFLGSHDLPDKVTFVCFDRPTMLAFAKALASVAA